MNNYQPRITKNNESDFYALVVRIEEDGYEVVQRGFGNYYKTEKSALRYANKFIQKCINA